MFNFTEGSESQNYFEQCFVLLMNRTMLYKAPEWRLPALIGCRLGDFGRKEEPFSPRPSQETGLYFRRCAFFVDQRMKSIPAFADERLIQYICCGVGEPESLSDVLFAANLQRK